MLTRQDIESAIQAWAPMAGLSNRPVSRNGLITDSGETAFFARQLEDIATELYNRRYPELQGRNILSVKTNISPGADFHVWRGYEYTSEVRETDDYSDYVPEGELEGGESAQKITGILGSYGYSVMDIRRAQFAGVPLDAMKAQLARDTMERKLDLMMAIGSDNRALNNIYGFYNHPSLPTAVDVSAQNTGAYGAAGSFFAGSTGVDWSFTAATGKAPNRVVADLNLGFNTLRSNSKYSFGEEGLTVVLDTKTFDLWNQTPANIGDAAIYSGISVMQYIRQTCGWIKNVKSWNRGVAAHGTIAQQNARTGGAMVMLFEDKPESGEFLLPQPFEQFPPQLKGMRFGVNMHMRAGGYIIRRPLAYQPIIKPYGT